MGQGQEALKGAAGGAMAGAALGTPGAIVGGVLGGALGYFGSGEDEATKAARLAADARYQAERDRVLNRAAPQAGAAAQAGESSFRGDQQSLVSQLQAMAAGRGPSLAGAQLQAATDRNIAQQQGLAASGRGNATAAAMGASNNSARLGAQAAQDSAMARIAEQQMALGQLGGVLNGARGQDQQGAQWNAGAQNDMARANLEAQLRAQGMTDDQIARMLQLQGGNQYAPAPGATLGDQILSGGVGGYAQIAAQRAQARASGAPGVGAPGSPYGGGPGYAPAVGGGTPSTNGQRGPLAPLH